MILRRGGATARQGLEPETVTRMGKNQIGALTVGKLETAMADAVQ